MTASGITRFSSIAEGGWPGEEGKPAVPGARKSWSRRPPAQEGVPTAEIFERRGQLERSSDGPSSC